MWPRWVRSRALIPQVVYLCTPETWSLRDWLPACFARVLMREVVGLILVVSCSSSPGS